ncbi:MAG: M1 family metallopeptidase, partial [Myxococcota bacterium]
MTRDVPSNYLLSLAVLALCAFLPSGCRAPIPVKQNSLEPNALHASPDDMLVRQERLTEEQLPTGQLPRDVRPRSYALQLTIIPERDRFEGLAILEVELQRPRNLLWLHGKGLLVHSAQIQFDENEETITAHYEQKTKDGVAALHLDRMIPAGSAHIVIRYEAAFTEHLEGLYRVKSEGEDYAFTQFEAIHARTAFPCFDEPSFKVPFDVSIRTRSDLVALTNTPVIEERFIENGLKETAFARTQAMPTYLLAFAVGPLDVVEYSPIAPNSIRTRPVPLRGIAVKGKGTQLTYALERVAPMLRNLEQYFNIPYPYRKLDIVAVPDFRSGAMENVGLITFREEFLLMQADSPQRQLRGYAHVMAHELAHQWFGNLVTMPWWDDLWLNEAFATWMGHRVVSELFPEYLADVGLLESVHRAMRSDSLVSARQIRQPIESNHDIRNAFDSITYRKGGGVLSMFESYLGEETFREGIRNYIRGYQFGNATASNLLSALNTAAGHDIASAFQTFLTQPGIPLLKTQVECGAQAFLNVEQSRFLPAGSRGSHELQWKVPLCIRMSVNGEIEKQCVELDSRESSIALTDGLCPDWVMPNADGAGYFRLAMAEEDLVAVQTTAWRHLTNREKLAIADSVVAGFDSGTIRFESLMEIFPSFVDEIRPIAILPARVLRYIDEYLISAAARPALKRYGRSLYEPLYRQLGWEGGSTESGEKRLLRPQVLAFLAEIAQVREVRLEAKQRAHRFLGYPEHLGIQKEALDPNLITLALSIAVQDSGTDFFNAVVDAYFDSTDAMLRRQLLAAIGSTSHPDRASRALNLALDARLRVNEVLDT